MKYGLAQLGRTVGTGITIALLSGTTVAIAAEDTAGAVETTPLHLAAAYTALAGDGVRRVPYSWTRLEKPGGGTIHVSRVGKHRVADAASTWLVRDALREAVTDGTGKAAAIPGLDVAAKTGTTNDLRDAWLAGFSGSVVTVVWVGLDDGSSLGLSGGRAAAPIWKEFMEVAVPARPGYKSKPLRFPLDRAWINPERGWSLKAKKDGAVEEWFRPGTVPPRKRWWRRPKIAVLEVERVRIDD